MHTHSGAILQYTTRPGGLGREIGYIYCLMGRGGQVTRVAHTFPFSRPPPPPPHCAHASKSTSSTPKKKRKEEKKKELTLQPTSFLLCSGKTSC